MSANDTSASNLLGIYEHRLSMSERGVTRPTPQVVAGMQRLVAALRALRPEERISLDATDERAIFVKTASREFVAQIDFDAQEPNQTSEPMPLKRHGSS